MTDFLIYISFQKQLSDNIQYQYYHSLYQFSNHLPIFTCLPIKNVVIKPPKFVNITKNDENGYQNLRNAMQTINWSNLININTSADPSLNYSIFQEKLTTLKNEYLPTKVVRFHRHKHKNNEWITTGLLNSIKQKDYLYKKLKCLPPENPHYNSFKEQFLSYEKI